MKAQVDEEILLHLDLRTEQLTREGMDPDEARREALRLFGTDTTGRKEAYRAAKRRDRVMGRRKGLRSWLDDLTSAYRRLRAERGFVLFVATALALGIGANAAMYGVLDRILLRGPDHVRDPGSVVRVYLGFQDRIMGERVGAWIPLAIADHLSEEAQGFSDLAPFRVDQVLGEVGGMVRPLSVATVGSSFFRLLGVQPRLGRWPEEAETGAGAHEAIISHGVWMEDFGGGSDALGQAVQVGSQSHTVIGVAPPGFTGPDLGKVDIWVPIERVPGVTRNYKLLGRMTENGLIPVASESLRRSLPRGHEVGPEWAREGRPFAAPLGFDDEASEPPEVTVARLMTGVTVLVLIIACANVGNLLLARVARRRRESSVRLALGAGRGRLMRLHLCEGLLLGALGGIISLPVSLATGTLVRAVLLPQIHWTSSALDWRILGAAAFISGLTGLVVGALPALDVGRTRIDRGLREARMMGIGRGRTHLHLGLTVMQVAFSAALLMGAGSFIKSYFSISGTRLGFDPAGVFVLKLRSAPPEDLIPIGSQMEADLYRRAEVIVSALPGVRGVARAVGVPVLENSGISVHVDGLNSFPSLPGGGPFVTAASPGYFQAMGTRVLVGRAFHHDDGLQGAEPVVMVSESMASLLWPGGEALGRCLRIGAPGSECSEVVGVVEDVHRVGYEEPPSMQYYLPLGPDAPLRGPSLVLRVVGGGAGTLKTVREAVLRLDPAVAYADLTSLQEALDPETRPWRLGTTILSLCAALALLVALVGVYGVLTYLLSQRRQELGVRIALGATEDDLQKLLLKLGLGQAGLGIVVAMGILVPASRWIDPLLFETSVFDPVLMAAVGVTLLGLARLASFLPARRAARIDPVTSLKSEA